MNLPALNNRPVVARLPTAATGNTLGAQTQKASEPKSENKALGHSMKDMFEAQAKKAPEKAEAPKKEMPAEYKEAVARADEFLNPKSDEKRGEDWHVTHNGRDGKATGKKEEAQASKLVKANEKLEKEALSKLSEGERNQYKEVKDAIATYHDKGSEQLALQKLLFQGKLPGEKDLKGEGTTLDHLARAAKGDDLAKGVQRGDFAGTLARELATPSSINQGSKGTCAPTALSINLAEKNPAEYARISVGLASKEGKVDLADGKTTLHREKETSFKDDGSNRSINQRILAPALMEMSNLERDYNDKSGDGAGATSGGLDKLNDAISGKDMKSSEFGDKQKDTAMRIIDSELSQDRNVMTGMRFEEPGKPHSFHEVLVTGTSKDNGKDFVHFTNPWGDEEKMSRDDFKNRVFSANYEGPNLGALARATQLNSMRQVTV
ncbi:hypothetical protein [Hyalangium rubrum]|uniref:Uncharacterized protein n=1 Tax=Hyalangium rubrum TaxID=3103134 RepID=A0ABU5GVU9_9BACT|nr:hypothetical protein [Hyalangium sp. s54d21]MDY7225317.1 hypothetical protein [Hyalangium sp. s54d21]